MVDDSDFPSTDSQLSEILWEGRYEEYDPTAFGVAECKRAIECCSNAANTLYYGSEVWKWMQYIDSIFDSVSGWNKEKLHWYIDTDKGHTSTHTHAHRYTHTLTLIHIHRGTETKIHIHIHIHTPTHAHALTHIHTQTHQYEWTRPPTASLCPLSMHITAGGSETWRFRDRPISCLAVSHI